ncbi:MAG: glutamate racemase [Leptospiraceae bacterium]|nr:glutamate racemase [Leptospiraceae bacterium]MCK6382231.1 glutamate racemase [Leptospiraceae bacterium]NUM43012.1 glutamate racemase [Leptospiraceae bacterium]
MSEKLSTYQKKIGVFDSGMGGISVLREMNQNLKGIDFFYYGDIANSPYGNKSKEEITKLTKTACEYFLEKKVDAILLACNTATSASAKILREEFSIPIFGMEPALKPALMENPGQKIAVLATQFTISEDKFLELEKNLNAVGRLSVFSCEGLASLVDQKNFEKSKAFLEPILEKVRQEKIQAIVLGCTHYVLLKKIFHSLYPNVRLYDGNKGTYTHVQKSLNLQIGHSTKNHINLFLNGGSDYDYSTANYYLQEPFS